MVGIPTSKSWHSLLDFDENKLISRGLHTQFPLIFESTKHVLPPGAVISVSDFVRPLQGSMQSVTDLLTNLGGSASNTAANNTTTPVTDKGTYIITQTATNGCIHRDIDILHIK